MESYLRFLIFFTLFGYFYDVFANTFTKDWVGTDTKSLIIENVILFIINLAIGILGCGVIFLTTLILKVIA